LILVSIDAEKFYREEGGYQGEAGEVGIGKWSKKNTQIYIREDCIDPHPICIYLILKPSLFTFIGTLILKSDHIPINYKHA
jgi:hypothetical protein